MSTTQTILLAVFTIYAIPAFACVLMTGLLGK